VSIKTISTITCMIYHGTQGAEENEFTKLFNEGFKKCGKEMCTFSMQHIPCRMTKLIRISFLSVRK
jgi:hypothetical protein